MNPDVIVIGGGIAGLATARHLALRGARACLIEREPLLATHASGRNAAIFRQIDGELTVARLAQRTRQLLRELGPGLLCPTGAIFVGEFERLAVVAKQAGVGCERLDAAALHQRVPLLEGGDARGGLFFPDDGVLDLHALVGSLALGADLRTGTAVRSLMVREGKVGGVILETGETLRAPKVVMAAGAWTAELGRASGVPLPIEPRRRHLAMLVSEVAPASGPVVWRLGEEVYFRPETGGVLASPCDEQPWAPGVPPTEADVLVQLAQRLSRLAPKLGQARVRSAWACLRSFAPDGGLVAGLDPRLEGLTWIAGLGGRGMSCGLGLGEVAAAVTLGEAHELAEVLSPARLKLN